MKKSNDLTPLFETLVKQVGSYPVELSENNLVMQVSSLAYDSFIGRIGIGRIFEGSIKENQTVSIVKNDRTVKQGKIAKLMVYQGLNRVPVKQAFAGDIITFAGIEDISIGDTVNELNVIKPLNQFILKNQQCL